jgi:hypothetical protein
MKMTDETKEWVTLQEASKITKKSVGSIRMFIKRKGKGEQPVKAKKISENAREYWVIHSSELNRIDDVNLDNVQGDVKIGEQNVFTSGEQVITMPAEVFIRQQKERDELVQGMLMYRFKFEELDRLMKCLPAPVESVTSKLEEQEQEIARLQLDVTKFQEKEQEIARLQEEKVKAEQVVQENEALKTRLREMELPWWKKIFRPGGAG